MTDTQPQKYYCSVAEKGGWIRTLNKYSSQIMSWLFATGTVRITCQVKKWQPRGWGKIYETHWIHSVIYVGFCDDEDDDNSEEVDIALYKPMSVARRNKCSNYFTMSISNHFALKGECPLSMQLMFCIGLYDGGSIFNGFGRRRMCFLNRIDLIRMNDLVCWHKPDQFDLDEWLSLLT